MNKNLQKNFRSLRNEMKINKLVVNQKIEREN